MNERRSTIREEVLKKYPNLLFVETGTYDGSGVIEALRSGFRFALTVEISPRLFWFTFHRLRAEGYYTHVQQFLGDSAELMPKILEGINEQTTFWLDAHQPQDNVPHTPAWMNCPLSCELTAIAFHPIKTHTILIDDRDHFGTGHVDFNTEDMIKMQLLAVNPNYKFRYEDGNAKDSILAAYV